MRARYYSPEMKRFINADIVAGQLSNAITLNRFAYANGNPVSFVDPFGLSPERGENKGVDTSEEIDAIKSLSALLNISYQHARIIYYASQWSNHAEVKWTTLDILYWQTFGGDEFLKSKKTSFISNYRDVIKDAALRYDIPEFLLAGIAFSEFGGDPLWIDDLAYAVRSFDWCGPDWVDNNLTITKRPELTSFGNTSIQVRRALEMLDYTSSSSHKSRVIKDLKDPIKNIYMAARHLDVLRDVDFPDKTASELSDEDIQIIASRYNLGPDCSVDASEWSYGKSVMNNKDTILAALSP